MQNSQSSLDTVPFLRIKILLVDDGSKDGSGSICDAYARKDARIRVFHTNNQVLASTSNFGLDHAAGEWLSFIDIDGWIEADTMDRLLGTAAQHGADITVGRKCSEYA